MRYAPEADFTATWTRDHLAALQMRADVLVPPIRADFPVMSDEVWLWDTWPLTDLSMRPVRVNGWHVIMGLTAPRTVGFDERHAIARIGWFASRDGKSWAYRGPLIPEGSALGTRQWSGSAVLVGDRVHLFYTAVGQGAATGPDWLRDDTAQRIAHATAVIRACAAGVSFAAPGFADGAVVAEGDGELYQTHEQGRDSEIVYGFRDPFVFSDLGSVFMTFTGNMPGPGCFTGSIGLARARDATLTSWQLLPPLLHAPGVNQQLERPHIVRDNGLYYLLFVTHQNTYASGLRGPDGLYAFVGDGLRSDYRPVNGSGAAAVSELDRTPQRFADYVMPNWLMEGFIDAVGPRRGGTLAPTLQLAAHGDTIAVTRSLGFGEIPELAEISLDGSGT